MEDMDANDNDTTLGQRERQQQELQVLRAANDVRWQRLQSLLTETSNAAASCGSYKDSPFPKSIKSIATGCDDHNDKTSHDEAHPSVADLLRAESDLVQNSPHSAWINGIDDLLQRLQVTKSGGTTCDEETMIQFDRELVENYQELVEVDEYVTRVLRQEQERLQGLMYQKEELEDLHKQIETVLAERERELAVHVEPSSEAKALAIDADHERLRDELVYIAGLIDRHDLNPPAPAPSTTERYMRQVLDPLPEAPASTTVPFPDMLLDLVHRLAVHDMDEDQYLQLITERPNETQSDIIADGDAPMHASNAHNPRHVKFLLELGMLEADEDNPSFVRLLREYKAT